MRGFLFGGRGDGKQKFAFPLLYGMRGGDAEVAQRQRARLVERGDLRAGERV